MPFFFFPAPGITPGTVEDLTVFPLPVLIVMHYKAVDTLINYETVKMFGMESEETTAYQHLQRAYQNAYIWFRVTLNGLNFGQSAIQTLGLGVSAILAAIAAAKGRLTPGDFVLVNQYVQQLFQPLFVRDSPTLLFFFSETLPSVSQLTPSLRHNVSAHLVCYCLMRYISFPF